MATLLRLTAALAALGLVAAGCGDDDDDGAADTTTSTFSETTTTTGTTLVPDCSAARSAVPDPQPDLPAPVATMRADILEAALACDYERLGELATGGEAPFSYSFGEEGGDPTGYWQTREGAGDAPLRALVEVLGMSFGTRTVEGTTHYVWPSAFSHDDWASVPEPAREELAALYSEEEISDFERFGSYIGWRAGISEGGDWLFFVEGD